MEKLEQLIESTQDTIYKIDKQIKKLNGDLAEKGYEIIKQFSEYVEELNYSLKALNYNKDIVLLNLKEGDLVLHSHKYEDGDYGDYFVGLAWSYGEYGSGVLNLEQVGFIRGEFTFTELILKGYTFESLKELLYEKLREVCANIISDYSKTLEYTQKFCTDNGGE